MKRKISSGNLEYYDGDYQVSPGKQINSAAHRQLSRQKQEIIEREQNISVEESMISVG